MTAKSGYDYRYWYLHGIPYDFTGFVKNHPGGIKAIMLGRGRDCTAMFESYHTYRPADALLEKYKVKDGKVIDQTLFTYEPNGFYMTLKERARYVLSVALLCLYGITEKEACCNKLIFSVSCFAILAWRY